MPTDQEIENMMAYAEFNMKKVFEDVYAELADIVEQNVWLTPQRNTVYTEDVDIDTLYLTTMNLFMGDYALFCMEISEEGADALAAQEFDLLAAKVFLKIKQILPRHKAKHQRRCREIDAFLQSELGKFGDVI